MDPPVIDPSVLNSSVVHPLLCLTTQCPEYVKLRTVELTGMTLAQSLLGLNWNGMGFARSVTGRYRWDSGERSGSNTHPGERADGGFGTPRLSPVVPRNWL